MQVSNKESKFRFMRDQLSGSISTRLFDTVDDSTLKHLLFMLVFTDTCRVLSRELNGKLSSIHCYNNPGYLSSILIT